MQTDFHRRPDRSGWLRPAVLAAVLSLGASAAEGHPHVYVDVGARFVFQEESLRRVEMRWVVPELFGYDLGRVDAEWYRLSCRQWLDEYVRYTNYYCTIHADGRPVEEAEVEMTRIELDAAKSNVVFHLTVNADVPCDGRFRTIDVAVVDDVNYIAYAWLPGMVSFEGADDMKPSAPEVLREGVVLRFTVDDRTREEGTAAAAPPPLPEPPKLRDRFGGNPAYAALRGFQVRWNRRLHGNLTALRRSFDWAVMGALLTAALLYGVFHAAGPGHGKLVLGAYFLEPSRRRFEALALPWLVTAIHAALALALAGGFQAAVSVIRGPQRLKVQSWLSFGVALVVVLIGVGMAVAAIRRRVKPPAEDADARPSGPSGRGAALLAGAIPCPASITIMLACVAAGIPLVGVVLEVGISVGMGIVLTVVALGARGSGTILARIAAPETRTGFGPKRWIPHLTSNSGPCPSRAPDTSALRAMW